MLGFQIYTGKQGGTSCPHGGATTTDFSLMVFTMIFGDDNDEEDTLGEGKM